MDPETGGTAAPSGFGRRLDLAATVALVLAATLAFFHDSEGAPPGYPIDMVSVALNALCVAETGADEYGQPWPLVGFRSFDDYKGVANLYGLAAVFTVAPPTLHVARIFSMILTFGATAALALAVRRDAPGPRPAVVDAVFFGLMLLSPWLVHPKRVMVEDGVLYAVAVCAVLTARRLLQAPGSISRGMACGVATGVLAHCYSPGKVLFVASPLLIAAALVFEAPRDRATALRRRGLWTFLGAAALFGVPHLVDLVGARRGLSRFRAVGGHFDPLRIVEGLAHNGSPAFLFFSGDPETHRHFGHGGMLNLFFLPLAVAGVFILVRHARTDAFARYSLGLIPVAFLPAALAEHTPPHGGRALLVVIPLAIASHYALDWGCRLAATPPGRRHVAAALFMVWTGFGVYQAVATLGTYFGPYAERNLWHYTRPKPRWRLDAGRPGASDHSPDTAAERYFRAAHLGQMQYCGSAR